MEVAKRDQLELNSVPLWLRFDLTQNDFVKSSEYLEAYEVTCQTFQGHSTTVSGLLDGDETYMEALYDGDQDRFNLNPGYDFSQPAYSSLSGHSQVAATSLYNHLAPDTVLFNPAYEDAQGTYADFGAGTDI